MTLSFARCGQVLAHNGSSKFRVWQAVRASSAATYYLDDYIYDGDKYQDGAIVANNPSIIALQVGCGAGGCCHVVG